MPVTEQSVVIARPASEVWDFLTDAANWPSWEASIVECEQVTDGELGVGTRWRGVNRVLGKRIDWETEFVEYQPAKVATSKSVEGGKIQYRSVSEQGWCISAVGWVVDGVGGVRVWRPI